MTLRMFVFASLLAFAMAVPPLTASAGGGADLAVSVTGPSTIELYAGPTPVSYGGGNYSVTYTNFGPDTATNAVLTVRLGDGVYWDAFDTTFADCTRTSTGATCNLGTIAAGESITRAFALYPGTVGTWKTMYSVSADQSDNKQNNNAVVLKVAVIAPTHADLYLSPPSGSASATAGQPLTIGAFYGNGGPANATNVVDTVNLPNGVSFVADGSDSRCSASGQTLTCALGDEPYGSMNQTVHFNVAAAQVGNYTIRATISADQPDPYTANNTETVYLQVS